MLKRLKARRHEARKRREREQRRAMSRRSLLKYSIAAGAALSIPRWKVFEILERSGGKALAAEAACHPTNRSVHIVAGDGGFAWFQLLWPHNDVAAAGNANFAFHAPGQQVLAQGTDRPLTFAPQTPWQSIAGPRQVTALMSGSNETHRRNPTTATSFGDGTSMLAAAASLQSTNPTLVPVITVQNVPYGTAPGAPAQARVGNSAGMVDLFSSAASKAGGALENAADADLYRAHYQTLYSLNAAASRSTARSSFLTASGAAGLLGKNFADALVPTPDDLARYGIDGGSRNQLRELAGGLITTAKAFSLGLTSMVVLPAMQDDPHGAFNNMAGVQTTTATLGALLNGFMDDLMAIEDPGCTGTKLGDNTVITVHGDTPKTPLQRSGWPDGTPGNSNWMYVLGAGHLRSGWFGGIDRNGTARTFDPATGNDSTRPSAQMAAPASAAVTYAVAKGDMRRVRDFYDGEDISGIIREDQM
ncbi:MAG: hypothetical protein KJO07_15760 [Deltaproteobacteria bacterium]|nr:hypothetical protein [Deltaproteobacteria bacterium]